MTLTAQQLELLVAEAYAVHCIATNLGIEPDEVFVGTALAANSSPPVPCVVVTIQRREKRCRISVSVLTDESECAQFAEAWRRFANGGKSKLGGAELDRMVKRTFVWRDSARILFALACKGFELKPGHMVN
jgi:hypothetical protein